jgi:hypothetical protein
MRYSILAMGEDTVSVPPLVKVCTLYVEPPTTTSVTVPPVAWAKDCVPDKNSIAQNERTTKAKGADTDVSGRIALARPVHREDIQHQVSILAVVICCSAISGLCFRCMVA